MDADYVVVGAGSAGCVIASRLSETGARVVLLEAGPRDWHPMIHIPAGVLKLLHHPVVNWNYSAGAGPGTANRPIHWPRGKVLGGSSSINGMLYVRGNPADFDGWAQMGCRGWSFDDVLGWRQSAKVLSAAMASHRAKNAMSINQLAHGIRLAAEAVRFVVTGRGALTFGVTSAQVFCRSREVPPVLICNFCSRRQLPDAARFSQLEYAPGMTVTDVPGAS